MCRTSLKCLAVVCVAWVIAGCQVPREGAWLPDSSGFLFTDEDGSVLRFDVATGERQTVVAQSPTRTRILAVDPSGKRFALVRAVPQGTGDLVEVLFYDLQGKQVQKTEPVFWAAEDSNPPSTTPWQSGAVWSPKGKHLLIWYVVGSWDLRYGQCDVDAGTVKRLPVGISPLLEVLAFGLSPISDDDRGFLAVSRNQKSDDKPLEKPEPKQSPDPLEVFFIEWDGRQHVGRIGPEAKAHFEKFGKSFEKKSGSDLEPLVSETLLVPFPAGRWEQGTAVLEVAGGLLHIDTIKDNIEYRSDEQWKEDRRKMLAEGILYRLPIGQGRCAVVQCRIERECQFEGLWETLDVEIAGPEPGTTTRLGTVLISTLHLACGCVPRVAIPSPDGKSALVTYQVDGTRYTAVVSGEGKVLAKTPLP